MNRAHPIRYTTPKLLVIPVSDYRSHPATDSGVAHTIGQGVIHHDVVNIPFYGRVYDTATIAHPLSMADRLHDPRTRMNHVRYLLGLLSDIQEQCRNDSSTSITEWRARADSINVLNTIWQNWRRRFRPCLMKRGADEYDENETACDLGDGPDEFDPTDEEDAVDAVDDVGPREPVCSGKAKMPSSKCALDAGENGADGVVPYSATVEVT